MGDLFDDVGKVRVLFQAVEQSHGCFFLTLGIVFATPLPGEIDMRQPYYVVVLLYFHLSYALVYSCFTHSGLFPLRLCNSLGLRMTAEFVYHPFKMGSDSP